MKFKRFSLLAILATLVTVGSVYATWDYITGGEVEGDHSSTLGVSIDGKTEVNDIVGSLDITVLPTFTIDHTGDYVPALTIAGDIEVTYTPALASQVNAVICTITVDFADTCTPAFEALFDLNPISVTTTAGTTFNVDNDKLVTNIKLKAHEALDTPDKYTAYANILTATGNGFVVTAEAVAA